MSRWLLMCMGCSIIIAVSSSPIINEAKSNEELARQTNEVASNAAAAPAAAAPPAAASPAASPPAGSDDDDDDDEGDDDDLDLTGDDDDDDEEEEEDSETASSDDEDDDDDDYDFERILGDIFGGDDDDEEEEEEEAASDTVSAAPQAIVSSTAATSAPIQGLSASTPENAEPSNDQGAVNEDEDQVAEENNSHTVTLLTNGQPDELDEVQEQIINTNDIGAAAAAETASAVPAPAPAPVPADTTSDDDEEDAEEDDDDDDDVLGDDDDDDDEDDEEEEDEESRKQRALQGVRGVPLPSSYIAKYNKYVDSIFSKINKILKKNYDPVNVRLQTAPEHKKKPTSSKSSTKHKKRPSSRPSSRTDEANNGTMSTTKTADVQEHTRTARSRNRSSRLLMKKKTQTKAAATISTLFRCLWSIMDTETGYLGCSLRANKERRRKTVPTASTPSKSGTKKSSPVRAKATLYGLSSLRRDGDVIVNVMNTHTTVRSKFLVGPLTLKVEKEFGRGAKKEMRSATATTAEMVGKLNLKVVHGGDAALSFIRVMQPKQMRVETPDDNDKTKEFLWKRSSNLAHLVSQKLTNAAKSFLKPVVESSTTSRTKTN